MCEQREKDMTERGHVSEAQVVDTQNGSEEELEKADEASPEPL